MIAYTYLRGYILSYMPQIFLPRRRRSRRVHHTLQVFYNPCSSQVERRIFFYFSNGKTTYIRICRTNITLASTFSSFLFWVFFLSYPPNINYIDIRHSFLAKFGFLSTEAQEQVIQPKKKNLQSLSLDIFNYKCSVV